MIPTNKPARARKGKRLPKRNSYAGTLCLLALPLLIIAFPKLLLGLVVFGMAGRVGWHSGGADSD
jgi:hypothetical protein